MACFIHVRIDVRNTSGHEATYEETSEPSNGNDSHGLDLLGKMLGRAVRSIADHLSPSGKEEFLKGLIRETEVASPWDTK